LSSEKEAEERRGTTRRSLTRLLIDLVSLPIGRVRIVGRISGRQLAISGRVYHSPTWRGVVLTRYLAVRGLVPQGRKLWTNTGWVGRILGGLRIRRSTGLNLAGLSSGSRSTFSLFSSLALVLLFLLSGFPLLSDLFEFCGRTKLSASDRQTRQRKKGR
jgi:hypothetical protein